MCFWSVYILFRPLSMPSFMSGTQEILSWQMRVQLVSGAMRGWVTRKQWRLAKIPVSLVFPRKGEQIFPAQIFLNLVLIFLISLFLMGGRFINHSLKHTLRRSHSKRYFTISHEAKQVTQANISPISHETQPSVIWKWNFGLCDLLSRLKSKNITHITQDASECDMKVIFCKCAVWHTACYGSPAECAVWHTACYGSPAECAVWHTACYGSPAECARKYVVRCKL